MEVYMIMRKSLLRLDTDELLKKDTINPTPQRIVEFVDSSLPIGMGGFLLDSKLYFAGGQRLVKDIPLDEVYYSSRYLDVSCESDSDYPGHNSKVYMFQPSSSSSIPFTLEHDIPQMNQPKTRPFVATVEGKIYILSSYPYISRYNNLVYPPPFECYNPITNSWEDLPEPPYFKTELFSHYIDHLFVSGNKIYLRTPFGIQYFDVHTRQWSDILDKHGGFDRSLISKWMSWVSFAKGDEGIAIAYELNVGLVAFEYGNEMDDPANTIMREQLLDIITIPRDKDRVNEGFLRHMGTNKFLFIISTLANFEAPWLVHVYIFEVKKKMALTNDGWPGFLDAILLCSHSYDWMKVMSFDIGDIQDVIIVSKRSKKRKVDEVEI